MAHPIQKKPWGKCDSLTLLSVTSKSTKVFDIQFVLITNFRCNKRNKRIKIIIMKNKRNKIVHKLKINIFTTHYDQSVFTKVVEHSQYLTQWSTKNNCKLLISANKSIHAPPRLETELSICRSFLCLGWERFPVLSQIKLQALRQTGD